MIVGLIKELAEYEKLPDKITTTEEDIRTTIANRDIETLFASSDGKDVGFAMFLDNYASIFGAKGMFIENLYVRPEYRGNGIGEAMMRELCSWLNAFPFNVLKGLVITAVTMLIYKKLSPILKGSGK
jgi:GNAT superfamily N-acetyltransferase